MKFQYLMLLFAVCLVPVCSAQDVLTKTSGAPSDETPGVDKLNVTAKPRIEVVFVLDTTGSMGGLIEAAKQKIWAIANTLVSADKATDINFGLIGYRDRNDAYITKLTDLTEDIDAVYSELMMFQAAGGGDGPESVNQALYEAIHKVKWTKGDSVYRVIYLVGDAPPHMDYDDDITYKDSCKVAAERGIFINTIQCGNQADTTPIWQEIAQMSEGQFAQIEQSGGAIVQESPFDRDIAEYSKKLDATRMYYGDAAAWSQQNLKLEQGVQIYKNASVVSVAQRAAFNCTTSGMCNFAGFQELVSDVTAGKVEVADIKKETLPAQLQKLSVAEIEKLVAEKAVERAEVQEKIVELSDKRQQWLKGELAKKGESEPVLDRVIFDTIRTQASSRGIVYDEFAPKL